MPLSEYYFIALGGVLIAAIPETSFAQNCKANGGLAFVGITSDSSSSVWLSGTSAGSFDLEAAQGNQLVDSWSRARRGLHVSVSPFVSNGSGGTHKLFDTGTGGKRCLIDTQNQKGGFTLPPDITLPGLRFPGHGMPPIGKLFPDFLTPTVPGGVTPPIATLPPTGITPELPGGVTPPIGTLPPTGITPELPGGVTPPIATLPPSGITPALPGGVTPPIATLPPTGITPELPGGVTPPIATLPPTGITPTVPGSASARAGDGKSNRLRTAGSNECIDPRAIKPGETWTRATCPRSPLANGEVALTPGRDLGAPTLWNAWTDGNVAIISDDRYGLDSDTTRGGVTFGLDRRMSDDVVLGMSISLDTSRTDAFGDLMRSETRGVSVSPYLAVRLSPHWAVDASLSYGQIDSDVSLAELSGSYSSRQYSASIDVHGQYAVDKLQIRPKLSVTYSHIDSDSYDMEADVLGKPVNVRFPEVSFNYGVVGASAELSRTFVLPNDMPIMPYAEFGVQYEFDRPSGGLVLTSDLSMATPSAWSGSLRSGFRMLVSNSAQLEASVGYLSFGQNGLDAWDGRLHLSIGF